MKFCDKLTNLRKSNNLSQEQLADKLGISRQAVSKWESGLSVPDMEKMMQLCKILNCNLEDLIDDGVSSKKTIETKGTWREYYQEFLDFITKTLNMFWSMRLIEKVKCLLEMFFIGLILLLIWSIISNVIYSIFYPILSLLPDQLCQIIISFSSFIYTLASIGISIILMIHIFKIRYLDYFITVEDNNVTEKVIETPIEEIENPKGEASRKFIEKKKNKIIIRDPRHSTYGFFGFLAKLVVLFLKFIFIICSIPCIFSMIGFTFLGSASLWYIKDGFFFFGIFIILVGCILINYLILKIIYYFIFDIKNTYQKIFIILIIGLMLTGMGASISFCNYLTFKEVTITEHIDTKRIVKELEPAENMTFEFLKDDNVELIVDNTIDNIKVEIECPTFLDVDIYTVNYYKNEPVKEEAIYQINRINHYYNDSPVNTLNSLIKLIQEKKRISLKDSNPYQIKISASTTTIQQLENIYKKYY